MKPANTEEELEALENRLEDKNEGAELVSFNPQVVLGSQAFTTLMYMGLMKRAPFLISGKEHF